MKLRLAKVKDLHPIFMSLILFHHGEVFKKKSLQFIDNLLYHNEDY